MSTTRLAFALRKKRAERTMRDVAAEIGISAATLLRLEGGKPCDAPTLFRISEWLGQPMTEFVNADGFIAGPAWRATTRVVKA